MIGRVQSQRSSYSDSGVWIGIWGNRIGWFCDLERILYNVQQVLPYLVGYDNYITTFVQSWSQEVGLRITLIQRY